MKKTGSSQNSYSQRNQAARAASVNSYSYSYSNSSKSKNTSTSKTAGAKKTPAKKNTKKPLIIALCSVAAVAVVALVLLILGVFAPKIDVTMADGSVKTMKVADVKTALNSEVFFDGIIIDGVDVSGMTKAEATAAIAGIEPEEPIEFDIKLHLDGQTYNTDFSSLPLQSNKAEIVEIAYAYARPTSDEPTDEELIACYNSYQALKNTPMEFDSAYTLDTAGIGTIIHAVLDPLNSLPQDAMITGFDIETEEFIVQAEQNGYSIDIDQTIADVKAMLDSAVYAGTVDVNAQITAPTVTAADFAAEYGLVSESSSHTTANNSRNHNIRITCEKIDGLIVQPGESFSFNGFVGERTPEAGYELAGTIQNGTTEEAYGGGICQLSSMIYQSVVKANLQVDERHPHMWPSSYAAAGTDAAVDWGSEDFAFTNNSEYPIAIHATYDNDERVVMVQIYGHFLPDGQHIEFIGEVTSSTPSTEIVYVACPTLAVGETNQLVAPHDGIVAVSYQVWYDAAGNEISRNEFGTSYYYLIKEKIEVGILNPDGTLAEFDEETGIVVTPTPTPVPVETVPETTPPPAETTPTVTPVPT